MEFFGLRRRGKNDWITMSLVAVFFFVIFFDLLIIFSEKNYSKRDSREFFNKKEKKITRERKDEKIIIDGWYFYRDNKRGFEIKYPENWKVFIENGMANSSWEQKITFRDFNKRTITKETGFDLFIYNTKKLSLIEGEKFNEIHKSSKNILIKNKECLEKGAFLQVKNEEYFYEIFPVVAEDDFYESDFKSSFLCDAESVINSFLSFRIIKIERPRPKPIITAPMPVAYDRVNGKLVCDKKNDKPRKSKKGKGKHLDMECCLDPDEYPNPHCTY